MFNLKGSVRSLLAAIVAAATGVTFDLSAAGSVRVPSPDHASSAVPRSYVEGIIQGLSPKGSVRAGAEPPSLAAAGLTYDGTGKTLTATTNGSFNDLALEGISDFAVGQKVFFSFTSSNRTRSGAYAITDLGDGSSPFVLTRVSNFDSSAEITVGSFFFIEEGSTNQRSFAYLTNDSAPTLDTTDLLFSIAPLGASASYSAGAGLGLTGTTFSVNVDDSTLEISTDTVQVKDRGIGTSKIGFEAVTPDELALSVAGDGLNGGDGTALSVQAKSGGVVVVDGDGVDVQAASGSQAGTMSSADYTKLGRLADAVARGQGNTTNDGTYSLSLPTLGADRVQRLKVEITSQSLTDTAECKVATVLLAARRGSSGNSEIIGPATNPERGIELENLDDAGAIVDVLVEYIVGTNGADSIRVTGVNSHNIDHDVTASIRYLG